MLELTNHGGVAMTNLYSWQQSYQDALLELNPAQLPVNIDRAVSELEQRIRELMSVQDVESIAERQAIVDALRGLDTIKRFELTKPSQAGAKAPTT